MLTERGLLDEKLAGNLLSWKHSGFSIDNSVRILDRQAQANLAEYISRPPISLKKIRYEPFKGRVLFHTAYSEYFKLTVFRQQRLCTYSTLCSSCGMEMPTELTQHSSQRTSAYPPIWVVLLTNQRAIANEVGPGATRTHQPQGSRGLAAATWSTDQRRRQSGIRAVGRIAVIRSGGGGFLRV